MKMRALFTWISLSMSVALAQAPVGNDFGAKINASLVACNGRCAVKIPAGTYSYSTDIVLLRPATLECDSATVLEYKGTGNAIKLGRDGLTVSTYSPDPFEIRGCTFTGGSKMVHGILVNEFVVESVISGNYFHNFGNARAFDIWYQGQNWDARVLNNYMWADAGQALTFNGIGQNAGDSANSQSGDFGQSQLFLLNNHIQNIAAHKEGIGVYVNGINSQLIDNVIAGFAPNIQLGAFSNASQIRNATMERPTAGSAPCISFGDSSGPRVGAYVDGVTIADSTCNVHNTDFGTGAHFIGPTTDRSGMQNFRLVNNTVAASAAGQPMVIMNDLGSQTGNYAAMNRIGKAIPYTPATGLVHTKAPHLVIWLGSDEEVVK